MKAYCNIETDLSEEDFAILAEYFNVDTTQDIAKQKEKVADMLKWAFKKQMEDAWGSVSKFELRID